MSWTAKTSLSTILHVHILVIITISSLLELPAATVLELLGNLPPVEILSQPTKGRCTIGSVDFEQIESWGKTKGRHGHSFPEANPLNDLAVFVDGLTLLEGECGIWVHGRGLNEWLELITGMSWCSFNSNNTLNWLFTENGISES